MQVELALKSWRVIPDDKTKKPRITGEYAIMMEGREIASKTFNTGSYSGDKEIPFSPELMKSVESLENSIKDELHKLV